MKRIHVVLVVMAIMLTATIAFAAMGGEETKTQPLTKQGILQRYGFIDENGDGINDLARDSDNDGIPNCIDPDWVRPQDGTGFMNRYGRKFQHSHLNNGSQGSGQYNFNYVHQWLNGNSGGDNPGTCDPTDPNLNPNRNRRTNRKR